MEPLWTDFLFGLTLPAGAWIAIWAGPVTAILAFQLGIMRERRRENSAKRRAFAQIIPMLKALGETFEVFRPSESQAAGNSAQEKIAKANSILLDARSLLDWSYNHPEVFELTMWMRLCHLRDAIARWETDLGVSTRLLSRRLSAVDLEALAARLEPVFEEHSMRRAAEG